MPKANQRIFDLREQLRTVSWRSFSKDAWQQMRGRVAQPADGREGFLEFWAAEGYRTDKGNLVEKEVLICLKGDQARELRDALNEILAEEGE